MQKDQTTDFFQEKQEGVQLSPKSLERFGENHQETISKKQFITSVRSKIIPITQIDTCSEDCIKDWNLQAVSPTMDQIEWKKCSKDVHSIIERYYNLNRSTDPNSEQNYELFHPVFTLSKTFKSDVKYGCSWHKSWILPTITISLNQHSSNRNNDLSYPNLFVKISACIIPEPEGSTDQFEDVGLEGINQEIPFSNGIAIFKKLKFRGTSKNHK
jgi:hypothetical protein